MKVVIIAGGKGTRLGLTDIPKPMVNVAGKPILQWQIELAKKYNLKDIIILSGHLGNVIVDYFGDGSKFGVNIQHIIEKIPLGTAGAVKQLEYLLKEKFFVFYGDTIMDINLQSMIDFDNDDKNSLGTLLVHPNNHPYDSDLVESDKKGLIKAFHSKPHPEGIYYHNLVNAALYILDPKVFTYIQPNISSDFGKHIFPKIIQDNQLLKAYKTHEYIKDMGTLDRLQQVENDIISGKVAGLNIENKQKAIFIDRDGVINEEVDNLSDINDLNILPGVGEGLKNINKSEYLSIVVTNQPMIAKGFLKESELDEIHKKLEWEIGKEGSYIDDIYYCPHHPDKGFEGEIPELKIECECRKPKTGMIKEAIEKYNINPDKSFIIGDSTTDIQTGINTGLKTILVRTGYAGDDGKYKCEPDFIFTDFKEASDFVIYEYENLLSKAEEIIKNLQVDSDRYIILIGGLSRSGKTTFTNILTNLLTKTNFKFKNINLDNRLIPKEKRNDDMDVKARYQYDKITNDIKQFLEGKEIEINKYNIKDRTIIENHSKISFDKKDILVIDGVISLDIEYLRKISNIKVYCDIEENKRKERLYNFYDYKGLTRSDIDDLYNKRQKDEFPIITKTKSYADVIID
ncbi:HAD-IIIA family hydrolase [Candidatus Gracilibacteria bacterium]|nr:HAD-IIIA family hydrolase [Candidatus Gracilibacteria bacterium]